MSKILSLFKGDSLALAYGPDPEQSITNWTVKVRVKLEGTDTNLISQTLTAANESATERTGIISTSTLAPGKYIIVAKMTNSVTSESKETHDRFTVAASEYAE